MCNQVIFFPSGDGQDYASVAGVPEGMSAEEAQDRAQVAVQEFNEADREWCDAEDNDETEGLSQPCFGDFLRKNGLLVFENVISGPQWD